MPQPVGEETVFLQSDCSAMTCEAFSELELWKLKLLRFSFPWQVEGVSWPQPTLACPPNAAWSVQSTAVPGAEGLSLPGWRSSFGATRGGQAAEAVGSSPGEAPRAVR